VRADPVLEFLGACLRADRTTVDRLRGEDPAVVAQAIARRPHHISAAADKDRLDAVILMADLGFDVNAAARYPHQQTALHGAAFNGNLAMVEFLVAHGADPSAKDCSFRATPLGWAEHNQQTHVVEYLREVAR
jgi:ankyrin repeat protein